MEIYLIRHTKVEIDEKYCYGQTDIGLAKSFAYELSAIKQKLPQDLKPFVFYSSPLTRCLNLAKELSSSEPDIDKRIMELNFGEWELKDWNDIYSKEWFDDFVNYPCPKGESYIELYNRTVSFLNDLIKTNVPRTVVVTHAGVIRALIAHLLQIPLNRIFSLQISYGSITKVLIDGELLVFHYINR